MNFLGHLALSGNDNDVLFGNFIADAIKGKSYLDWPKKVQKGILLHRFIDDFTDTHFFTKNDLDKLDTIHKLNEIRDRLDEYYIPCKSKTYLQDITLKRSIVILRHFLKCHNYNIHSKE